MEITNLENNLFNKETEEQVNMLNDVADETSPSSKIREESNYDNLDIGGLKESRDPSFYSDDAESDLDGFLNDTIIDKFEYSNELLSEDPNHNRYEDEGDVKLLQNSEVDTFKLVRILVDNSHTGGVQNGSEESSFSDIQSAINYATDIRDKMGPDTPILIQVMEGSSNIGNPYDGFKVNLSNIIIQSHPENVNLPRVETQGDSQAGAIKGTFGTINVVEQSDVTIDGFYVADSHNIGIYVSGSDTMGKIPNQIYSNISIINNVVENTDSAGISVSGTRIFGDNPIDGEHYLENILIQNNDVSFTNHKNANTEAISLGAGTNNFQIIDNTVHDTEQYGIDIKVGAKDGVVSGNHVYNIERFGIYVDSANRTIENVTIEDNLIHNVKNGIVLAREAGSGKVQVGGDESNINPNLINIDISDNIIFSTEQFGILVYRHTKKDAYGGEINVDIRDNTIFDWGLKNSSAEAIRVSKNLIDNKINITDVEPLDSLIVNDMHIIQNGIVIDGAQVKSHGDMTALIESANSQNNILDYAPFDINNFNQNGDDRGNIFTGDENNNAYAGNAGDDTISGSEGNDILYGGSGHDTVRGNKSDDILFGGDGNDILLGDAGDDIMIGDGSNTHFFDWDIVTMPDLMINSGDDFIFGGNGSDTLIGMSGDDTLRGGKGADILYGNDGADKFVVKIYDFDGQVDTIKDFSLAENDVLDLSDLISHYDPLNHALTDFVKITENEFGSYVYADIDGGSSVTKILFLENVTGITDEDSMVNSGHLIL